MMRTDYFDHLVPTVPTSKNTSGDAANPHKHCVSPLSPPSPPENGEAEKTGQVFTNYGTGYRHPDGRVDDGTPEPMPPPAEPWPADLDAMLRRVAVGFEWSQQDVADFRQWARRSPDGVADARRFLQSECAKLAPPGLTDRRRVVLDMLAADPALRVAWTCDDSAGNDPVRLVVAVRGAGCCEMGIPRAKFDALELPMLIEKLADAQAGTP